MFMLDGSDVRRTVEKLRPFSWHVSTFSTGLSNKDSYRHGVFRFQAECQERVSIGKGRVHIVRADGISDYDK